MTFLRGFGTAIALITALLAIAAYRRSAQTARPWGACLREIAGEWDARGLADRARRAAREGQRAALLEEQDFDRSLDEAGATASGR